MTLILGWIGLFSWEQPASVVQCGNFYIGIIIRKRLVSSLKHFSELVEYKIWFRYGSLYHSQALFITVYKLDTQKMSQKYGP